MKTRLENKDCLEVMAEYPDKYFDLAVVDPPYGINRDGQKLSICKNPKHNRKYLEKKGWDNSIPDENYFKGLFRISENQIIWGGNYFINYLHPTKGWIFWYKGQNDLTMSDGELAWSSFNCKTRQIKINRVELLKDKTFHPTQKPIKLYEWIYNNYAKKEFKIIDTHLGSGSNLIAAYNFGISEFVGCELDTEYFNAMMKRWEIHKSQTRLF